MASSAKLIERMIPDSLRLAEHPDASIVNGAIATVITAINESDAITLSGAAKDVHAALQRYYEAVYVPHINKEDEDWNAVKAKADKYRPEAMLTTVRPMKGGLSRYTYTLDSESGTVAVIADDGLYTAEYMAHGSNAPVAGEAKPTEREAIASLFYQRGAMPVIDGSPLFDGGVSVVKTKVISLNDSQQPETSTVDSTKKLAISNVGTRNARVEFDVTADGKPVLWTDGSELPGVIDATPTQYIVRIGGDSGYGATLMEAANDLTSNGPYKGYSVVADDTFSEANPAVADIRVSEAREAIRDAKRAISQEIDRLNGKINAPYNNDNLKARDKDIKAKELEKRYQPQIDKLNDELSKWEGITVEQYMSGVRP